LQFPGAKDLAMPDEAKSRDELLAEMQDLRRDLSALHDTEVEHERREAFLRETLAFVQSIVATVRHPLVVLGADLRVVAANASFYRLFRVTPQETEGRFLYDLGERQAAASGLSQSRAGGPLFISRFPAIKTAPLMFRPEPF
jgi:PAS domain-containing protein